jgi:carbon monoxide dehydrogenase subunit G
MKIEDEFRVPVSVDEAWKVLLDVERIAPCMPGAQLQEVEGDEYRGIVKVKVGPITAQYKGVAKITEANEGTRTVVLQAEGRDTRGQGTASATVTATLTPSDSGTVVHIDTDLNVTGKVAQFGRGVMADVSSKLLGQFAQNLERDVLSGDAPATEGPAVAETAGESNPTAVPTESTGPRKIDSPEPEPVDLIDNAGGAVAKRVAPIVIAIAALLTLRAVRRRRKRRKAAKA